MALIWGEVGVERPHVAFRASPGNPDLLCCLCYQLFLLPFCVLGAGWKTPNFCSSSYYHTSCIFCSKISYLPFVPSQSVPNILKFQYHLEAAKESWEEGFLVLCH